MVLGAESGPKCVRTLNNELLECEIHPEMGGRLTLVPRRVNKKLDLRAKISTVNARG
jgi:hypothetical protein